MKLIAITGGIGAGKSVLSMVLRTLGHSVYDCDSEAKRLMDTDKQLRHALSEEFGNDIYTPQGALDRMKLAQIIFGNDEARLKVNSVVHPAVKRDILKWAGKMEGKADFAFVETAILRESGLMSVCHATIHVTAPHELRVTRVMRRSGLTREQVEARIGAQSAHEAASGCRQGTNTSYAKKTFVVTNDGKTSLLKQTFELLAQL